jgi:hypothetical protein
LLFIVQYDYRTRNKQLLDYCLVHRTWTGSAQDLLWQRVSVWDPARLDKLLASPALGRHSSRSVILLGGKGKRVSKPAFPVNKRLTMARAELLSGGVGCPEV